MPDPSWQDRLDEIYQLISEMSRQTDPQAMVRAYADRLRSLVPIARRISLSRRNLQYPQFRVTRYSEWKEDINPWTQKDRLPLLSAGLFADLIYANRPVVIDDLNISADDPAAAYLDGQRSLMAIPMLDGGESLNMVISTQEHPHAFARERLPESFWLANLFGRATHNLVLKEELRTAYDVVDRELQIVSSIQRSLLPDSMPDIPGLTLAAHYDTSQRAGGDYYDFFPLADGQWGLLIADVSGHGTPAAVVMAITHCIAHLFPADRSSPGGLLEFVNRHLTSRYTDHIEAFVTAFYGVYSPATRRLCYASAGHNPPRWWQCHQLRAVALDEVGGLPLGVEAQTRFPQAEVQLALGDCLALYTDGITEAMDAEGRQFGVDLLDAQLAASCQQTVEQRLTAILAAVDRHTHGAAPVDDQTLVLAVVNDGRRS